MKYIQIVKNSLQELIVYRLNFFLWRFRVIVNILITYFLWQALYLSRGELFEYSQSRMLTYIMLIFIVNGVVLSTQTFKVGEDINYGKLSRILIQPVSYFGYIFSRDIADKLVNIVFSFFEFMLIVYILKPPIIVQNQPVYLLLFIIIILMASLLYFEIGLLLSFIGFWSYDTWAPRFVFYILVAFLAGTYFPLDVLPQAVYKILIMLPFPYLIYFPLKVYLGDLSINSIMVNLSIITFWIIVFFIVLNYVWKKGLRIYRAEGG